MKLIDGNQIAAVIVAELRAEISTIQGRRPCLTLVRVGDGHDRVLIERGLELV